MLRFSMVGSRALVIETLEFGLTIKIDIAEVCVEWVIVNVNGACVFVTWVFV